MLKSGFLKYRAEDLPWESNRTHARLHNRHHVLVGVEAHGEVTIVQLRGSH